MSARRCQRAGYSRSCGDLKSLHLGPNRILITLAIDPNEQPEAAARRELQEETGYGGGSWHALGVLHPAASRFNNQVHSFLATGVTKVAEPSPEESENLHLHEIPWPEFVDGLRTGSLKLPEANQMSSLLLVHLLATASTDPEIQRLRL